MKPKLVSSFLIAAVMTAPAVAEPLFQEGFERGESRFSFDGYSEDAGSGEIAVGGGERGGVWMTTFSAGTPGGYFGHRLKWRPEWGSQRSLYWAAYLRFGYRPGSAEWLSAGPVPYELRLPEIGGGQPGEVYGRIRQLDDAGEQGVFEVVTMDGQVHAPAAAQPLVSHRWHLVQIALEDQGGSDRIRIWINNGEESAPDYDYIGGDMVNFTLWGPGTFIRHGRRLHVPVEDTRLYYDDITVSASFIPLPVPQSVPLAPANLRVE